MARSFSFHSMASPLPSKIIIYFTIPSYESLHQRCSMAAGMLSLPTGPCKMLLHVAAGAEGQRVGINVGRNVSRWQRRLSGELTVNVSRLGSMLMAKRQKAMIANRM